MTWADGVLILLLAAFAANGIMIGLVRQLAGLTGLFLGVGLALLFYQPLAFFLMRNISGQINPQATAFLLIFFCAWVATNLAAFAYRPHGTDKDRDADWVDVAAGGMFGLLSGIVMLAVLVAGAVWLNLPVGQKLSASYVGAWLLNISAALNRLLGSWLPWS